MRVLAIVVILCTLLGVGCNSEKSNEVPNYDLGIEAYKRGHYAVALSNFESRAMKDKGDFVAQFCLGFMYDDRLVPVPKNLETEEIEEWYREMSKDWYKKAADQDYVPAQNNLARIYFLQSERARIKMEEAGFTPDLVDKTLNNLSIAMQWFKKPRVQTHYVPQYNIALIQYQLAGLVEKYKPSLNADKSYEAAVYWFTKAAEQGDNSAQYELAKRYYYNEGVDKNLTKIERWEKAVEWYEEAAKNSNADAQNDLADMYYQGEGVDKNLTEIERWEKAVEWYEEAAKNGNTNAQFKLAKMYISDMGVDENLTKIERCEKAVEWYKKAAKNGNTNAQNELADMYDEDDEDDEDDECVSEDLEKAARLYFQAAQRGNIIAQVNVGKGFEKGMNEFPQDNAEAYYWYSLALKDPTKLDELAAGENIAAKVTEWREVVGNNLIIDERKNEIQERVNKWRPKFLYAAGTGFYIDKKYILTNAHVARREEKLPGGGSKWHKYDELRIGYRYVVEKPEEPGTKPIDHDVDLALLFDESENMYTATFRNDPVYRGEKIALFGYPLSFHLSYAGNATSGDVSGLLGQIDGNLPYDPRNLFQHSAPQQGGNSGGPVFDGDGNVIGISVRSLYGSQVENVHFAIKFDVIQKFLKGNNINVKPVPKDTAEVNKVIDLDKISIKAEKFTKPVLCFKNITSKLLWGKRMDIDYWKF